MKCKNCGMKIETTETRCPYCGERVKAEQTDKPIKVSSMSKSKPTHKKSKNNTALFVVFLLIVWGLIILSEPTEEQEVVEVEEIKETSYFICGDQGTFQAGDIKEYIESENCLGFAYMLNQGDFDDEQVIELLSKTTDLKLLDVASDYGVDINSNIILRVLDNENYKLAQQIVDYDVFNEGGHMQALRQFMSLYNNDEWGCSESACGTIFEGEIEEVVYFYYEEYAFVSEMKYESDGSEVFQEVYYYVYDDEYYFYWTIDEEVFESTYIGGVNDGIDEEVLASFIEYFESLTSIN